MIGRERLCELLRNAMLRQPRQRGNCFTGSTRPGLLLDAHGRRRKEFFLIVASGYSIIRLEFLFNNRA
jgi:hypothetical protein